MEAANKALIKSPMTADNSALGGCLFFFGGIPRHSIDDLPDDSIGSLAFHSGLPLQQSHVFLTATELSCIDIVLVQ